MTRDLSPALRELLMRRDRMVEERDSLVVNLSEAEAERDEKARDEDAAEIAYERAKAHAFLAADAPTVREREYMAIRDTLPKLQARMEATAVRKAVEGRMRVLSKRARLLEKDFDNLTAAIHLANREIKADIELAGRAT